MLLQAYKSITYTHLPSIAVQLQDLFISGFLTKILTYFPTILGYIGQAS